MTTQQKFFDARLFGDRGLFGYDEEEEAQNCTPEVNDISFLRRVKNRRSQSFYRGCRPRPRGDWDACQLQGCRSAGEDVL